MKRHVKKGDTVKMLAGKDRGKTGKVLRVIPKKDKVIIEGLNVVKSHEKARQNRKGGVIEKSMPVHVSNVRMTNHEESSQKSDAKSKKKNSDNKEQGN